MSRTRFILVTCLLGGIATASALAAEAIQPASPADTVNALHASLTEAMSRSAQLGCEGRTQLMQPAVDAAFNLPFVAQRALRRHWQTLDAAQRERLTATLRTSFVATYATEFAQAGAVSFATGATETLANGDALVHSRLTPKGRSAITLDYVLKPQGKSWQVVNVLADGVSDLALRATQYDSVMKTGGLDALQAGLDAQINNLKARCK